MAVKICGTELKLMMAEEFMPNHILEQEILLKMQKSPYQYRQTRQVLTRKSLTYQTRCSTRTTLISVLMTIRQVAATVRKPSNFVVTCLLAAILLFHLLPGPMHQIYS